jgi:hypothetical protein
MYKKLHSCVASKAKLSPRRKPTQETRNYLDCARIRKLSDRGLLKSSRIWLQRSQGTRFEGVGLSDFGNATEMSSVTFVIDQSRRIADNSRHFEHYFKIIWYYTLPYFFYTPFSEAWVNQWQITRREDRNTVTQTQIHHIRSSNIYNFDEKGFLMATISGARRYSVQVRMGCVSLYPC